MDFIALLLSFLLVLGAIALIVLKFKQSDKVKIVFYAVSILYLLLMIIFGFYPYEGFTSGLTMVLYYMILYVFCILTYKVWNKHKDFLKWFIVYNGLFFMHLVVDMIDNSNNIFDDMSISAFIYAVLNIILVIILLSKREEISILVSKVTGGVFIILNTIAFIGNSSDIGETVFALILMYLFTTIVGLLVYFGIKKRILEYSEDEIINEKIENDISTELDDIS